MTAPTVPGCAIVGAGRLGTALGAALRAAGVTVDGPHGRGYDGAGHDVVVLCVPDAQIAAAAAAIVPRDGRLVGHTSGATPLGVLAPHEAFGLHPLMTVTHGTASFSGCGCATAGTTERARSAAHALAAALAMVPADIADQDRAAYHAAAAIASNFLVTLEDAAEQLLATTGASRDLLLPLVRATVENWGAAGAERALTGPIARGDEGTVARHRAAIADRTPELLGLFDVLAGHTRALASRAAATPAGVA
ncbi:DUF2520 domain-containing protein [Paraconexibacter antarcticus]|uniref:DUF2520 domain-containing protein n=1 Tax=Paraconexibacter antarcticus TaxID=2949664 RepID=A0ABY5DNP0_9ACTN|nr:Rossmann-like and DUF2520 domain-containing protein [Paraconexibacter antarcticus]UTI62476.1 DUF2520 domain-containing protein [Paraconexibacter antarcticus]